MPYKDRQPINRDGASIKDTNHSGIDNGMKAELDEAVNFFRFFLSAYNITARPEDPVRPAIRRLLRYIQADKVSIEGFSADDLPESIGYNREITEGKHRFVIGVSPEFAERMKSSGAELKRITQANVLSTVNKIAKDVGDVEAEGIPIMGNAEYEEIMAARRKRQ